MFVPVGAGSCGRVLPRAPPLAVPNLPHTPTTTTTIHSFHHTSSRRHQFSRSCAASPYFSSRRASPSPSSSPSPSCSSSSISISLLPVLLLLAIAAIATPGTATGEKPLSKTSAGELIHSREENELPFSPSIDPHPFALCSTPARCLGRCSSLVLVAGGCRFWRGARGSRISRRVTFLSVILRSHLVSSRLVFVHFSTPSLLSSLESTLTRSLALRPRRAIPSLPAAPFASPSLSPSPSTSTSPSPHILLRLTPGRPFIVCESRKEATPSPRIVAPAPNHLATSFSLPSYSLSLLLSPPPSSPSSHPANVASMSVEAACHHTSSTFHNGSGRGFLVRQRAPKQRRLRVRYDPALDDWVG